MRRYRIKMLEKILGGRCTLPRSSSIKAGVGRGVAPPHRHLVDSTGLFREAIIGFLAAIAKQERVRFSERIKAGQARSSKPPGRPALAEDVVTELRRLRGEGFSFKKIQVATGVPVATMHKYLVE